MSRVNDCTKEIKEEKEQRIRDWLKNIIERMMEAKQAISDMQKEIDLLDKAKLEDFCDDRHDFRYEKNGKVIRWVDPLRRR